MIWVAPLWENWRETGAVEPFGRLPTEEIAEAGRALEEPLAVILARQPLAMVDSFHLSMLETAGRFDSSDLVRRIKRGEFDLIVLRGDVQGGAWRSSSRCGRGGPDRDQGSLRPRRGWASTGCTAGRLTRYALRVSRLTRDSAS